MQTHLVIPTEAPFFLRHQPFVTLDFSSLYHEHSSCPSYLTLPPSSNYIANVALRTSRDYLLTRAKSSDCASISTIDDLTVAEAGPRSIFTNTLSTAKRVTSF